MLSVEEFSGRFGREIQRIQASQGLKASLLEIEIIPKKKKYTLLRVSYSTSRVVGRLCSVYMKEE